LQDSTRKTTNRLSCSIFRDTFRVLIAVVRIFSMKFRPLHDRVLVRPVEQEEKTAGGIIIPDTAKEKPMEGKVVASGPGVHAKAVKGRLRPQGRNVVLDKSFVAPRITKDGVTVAKEIELADKFENMGAQMVREVASKTSDQAGDGTTTATVLAQAIVREGAKAVAAGMNPMDLKRGMDLAVEAVGGDLRKRS